MASIMEYSLKAVKQFETMDGVAYSANIYKGNEKVGELHNDGRGGATDYRFITPTENENFVATSIHYFKKYPLLDSYFIKDNVTLADLQSCGGDIFKIPNAVENIEHTNFKEFQYDMFTEAMLGLIDTEKTFKKQLKLHPNIYLIHQKAYALKGYSVEYASQDCYYILSANSFLLESKLQKERAKYPLVEFKVYKSLADFIIE